MTVNVYFWSKQKEFTLYDAACLICEIEPGNVTKENRRRVERIKGRLKKEVLSRPEYDTHDLWNGEWGSRSGNYANRYVKERWFDREVLRSWCEHGIGLRPKFLFPEERATPQLSQKIDEGLEGKNAGNTTAEAGAKGGKKTSELLDPARQTAIAIAVYRWAREQEQCKPITRITAMTESVHKFIHDHHTALGVKILPGKTAVKNSIKDVAPPEASLPGPGKKDNSERVGPDHRPLM